VNRLRSLFRTLLVTRRSQTAVAALFVVAVAGGAATGFWLMFRLAYLVAIGVPVAWVWARLNASGLSVRVERFADRVQEGQAVEGRITIENRSWFGKLWLEVEDRSDLPGYDVRRVVSLARGGSRSWLVRGPASRRGVYSVGPVKVTAGDPFGLFRKTVDFGVRHPVLVFPRAVDLAGFEIPLAHLPGEGRFRRPAQTLTPNAAGVRPYAPGDAFNRIHWPTTARTGQPMVKLFELDPASDIWIVLDLHRAVHAGEGEASTEEYAVHVVASVARHFLMANRSVGFLAYGREYHVEEPDRGVQQYSRILEDLALARATGDVPLGELLANEARRFGRHTTVVVVTPATDDVWVASLNQAAQRGARTAAILIEAETFGAEGTSLLAYSALAASDVPTFTLRREADPREALARESAGAGGRR
jgi:uncharacterized protein (DUF58 family)